MEKNLLVAQSGGPTAVINASLLGVIQEAWKQKTVHQIYGSMHGIWRKWFYGYRIKIESIF